MFSSRSRSDLITAYKKIFNHVLNRFMLRLSLIIVLSCYYSRMELSMARWLVFFMVFQCFLISSIKSALSEDELRKIMENEYEESASEICKRVSLVQWNYQTDLQNKEKEEATLKADLDAAEFQRTVWTKYFKDVNLDDITDEKLKRQLGELKSLGEAALDSDKLTQAKLNANAMTNIYSTSKICPYKNQNCNLDTEGLSLEPGIESIFSKSTDYDELLYVWTSWRNATGAKMKNLYKVYVDFSNEAARANNLSDKGEEWRMAYESPNFLEDMDELWSKVEPLYVEFHKYVSLKLKQLFGEKLDITDGLTPAHIFGNMWAQDWRNIAELVRPFPSASPINVDKAMKEQNYTVLQMFQTADHFYESLGLIPLNDSYDESRGAMITKPTDGREVVCHASAWDFCDGETYRIKMCSEVNFEYFVTIHHELGHIEYDKQYRKLPFMFRNSANPGFHEAIGDTIALSVITPKHLEKIGLMSDYIDDYESSINSLMDMALSKVAFLPYGLIIDKWRWDVFAGRVAPEKWNSHWWEYRRKYQRMKPPVQRSDELDLDPASKYHVAEDTPFISYFVAQIIQFQFYKSLCMAAGEYDPENIQVPLHKCDFYESKEAGDVFSAGLKLGSSEHWSDVLEVMTGERDLNASALLEYFKPLHDFLLEYNSKT